MNTLRADVEVDADGMITSFAIVQEAPASHPTLRTHRIAVGCYDDQDGRLERRHRVEVDVTGARTEIAELVGRPRSELILVNDDDLTYAKVRFDPTSLATAMTRVGDLVDPLARAVCWTAAWDMTRDGEITASAFLDMVLGAIPTETESSVLNGVLVDLETALRTYAAPATAAGGQQRLADAAWAAMAAAEPGSGTQLTWSRCFARVAGPTSHAPTMRELGTGRLVVDGLEISFELRWALLHGAVPHGLAGQSDITAVSAMDLNSAAVLHAAQARAMIATAGAKAATWDLVVTDSGVPLEEKLAYATGFWSPAQDELLAPYTQRYFDTLAQIWALDDGGFGAHMITRDLFPRRVHQDVLDAAETWLGTAGAPATQARMVAEHRDELARALANRSIDA